MTTLADAIAKAMADAVALASPPTADDVVARVSDDVAAVVAIGSRLAEPGAALRAIDLASMLPDRAGEAAAALADVVARARALQDDVARHVDALAEDTRALGEAAQEVTSDEQAVEARMATTWQALQDLQRKVDEARSRQSIESSIPIFGPVISGLDGLIDDLVNQTDAKAREISSLRAQQAADAQRDRDLALALARIQHVAPVLSATLDAAEHLGAVTSDVRAKVGAVADAAATTAGLDPFVDAALESYATALSWCDRLAATTIPTGV
ncbi:MAG TPA: hypothetical protein VF519_05615 [Mycobacteriales bacterium]